MTTVLENLGSKQQEDVSSLTFNDDNSISMSLSSVGSKKTAKEKVL